MIARTISITQPAYLKLVHGQLSIQLEKEEAPIETSLEELGYLIIDHPQITLSQSLLSSLNQHNVGVVICNDKHHPHGLMLPMHHHHLAGERFRQQVNAPLPLKKQLWKQIIRSKVCNQSLLLNYQKHPLASQALKDLSKQVVSNDNKQIESQAARSYWRTLFGKNFQREYKCRTNIINACLNYGYAILRSVTARALIGSGLLPLLGLHHHNRYNAYPLADDIMEPYRPFVDQLIVHLDLPEDPISPLSSSLRHNLQQIPYLKLDCPAKEGQTLLHTALEMTTASLAQAFIEKKATLIKLPKLPRYIT